MHRFGFVGSLALVWTLSFSALAEDTAATQFVKGRQAELTALVKAGGAANNKRVEAVFDAILDYDALAQNSLREKWNERSDAEKKEFQHVLKRLVQRAYRKNLDPTARSEVK